MTLYILFCEYHEAAYQSTLAMKTGRPDIAKLYSEVAEELLKTLQTLRKMQGSQK